eukprot:4695165-Amphidinium_carterae.1
MGGLVGRKHAARSTPCAKMATGDTSIHFHRPIPPPRDLPLSVKLPKVVYTLRMLPLLFPPPSQWLASQSRRPAMLGH